MAERARCDNCGLDFEVSPEHPSPDGEACNRCDEGSIETYWDDEDENAYYAEMCPCECRFCHCANETREGGVCSECLGGVHQG